MYQQKRGDKFRRNPKWRTPQHEMPSPAPPFGTLIEAISVGDLARSAAKFASSARVTDCELMASYNWLDKAKPSILVPGAPPKWTPLPEPVKLREDDGVYYHNRNACRYPAHPMEPMVQAVMSMHPQPLTERVDLVACGSTLGNLLRFVRGEERPFRMLVEVVGDVVHLIRRENSPKEEMIGVRGYGHTFPEAYTTWEAGVRNSASHQRILRYNFGGLGCIVRHEGDGYLGDKLGLSEDGPKHQPGGKSVSIDELINILGDNKLNPRAPGDSSGLKLQSGGFVVPQSAVFDLKTRSIMRKDQDVLGQELPRMWVAQIPNFVLAYHERGVFNEIEVMDVSKKVKQWEKSMNKELSQLAALLHHIIGVARTSQDGRFEVSRQLVDKLLDIRAQTPGMSPVLSPDVMVEWEAWLTSSMKHGNEEYDDEDDEDSELGWSDGEGDYTACSQDCSYCGHCTY